MKKIIAAVLTFIVILFVFVAFVAQSLPTDYKIEVVQVIEGTPEAVYSRIGSFKEWPTWSPWKQEDSTMTMDFSQTGDVAKAGDVFSWDGKEGPGSLKVLEATPNSMLSYEMLIPGMSPSYAFFSVSSAETKTTILWSMSGSRTLIEKIFWRFLDIENEIKKKFTVGLENIRQQVEKK